MGNYVTVADLTKEGMPASVTADRANARITKWELIVERVTGNLFYEVTPGELTFDGNNSAMLHFNLPMATFTSLKINDETVALGADEFKTFLGRTPPQDDRQNPKIKLDPIRSSVFRGTPGMFVKGMDQKVTATWGYLEPDDSTPQPIVDAVIQLVLMDLDNYFTQGQSGSGGGTSGGVSPVKREKTDGHEIEYMEVQSVALLSSMIPADIYEVLALYRGPLRIASPEPIRFFHDPTIEVFAW